MPLKLAQKDVPGLEKNPPLLPILNNWAVDIENKITALQKQTKLAVANIGSGSGGNFTFGLRGNEPAPGKPGALYLETDTDWLYYDDGSAWMYLTGTNIGIDAQRLALVIGVNDTDALFITTDAPAPKLYRVTGGVWVPVAWATPVVGGGETWGRSFLEMGG